MSELSRQRVSIGFGKVNLPSELATFAAFRLKPSFERASALDSGTREPRTAQISAVSGTPQINGYMTRDYVTHPNGTILMLQASWKRGATPYRDGCILLRLRQEGPLLNVIAKLPTGRNNLLGDTYSVFQGYADLLSPDEALLHKVAIPSNYLNRFFDMEEIDECFEVQEVHAARVSKPAMSLVSTPQGVVMQEVVATPARRMRFRKAAP